MVLFSPRLLSLLNHMSLDRLIQLAKRTGDRLIVHDPSGENDLVIMDVDSYERLLDLETEPWERDQDEFEDDMPGDELSSWYSAADVLGGKQIIDNEIKIEDVPFASEASMDDWLQTFPVPQAHSSPLPSTWGEEPLTEDEPVFYEEPV